MNFIEKIKNSNAWDPRYNLPTIPMHNNPWIYLGYIHRILIAQLGVGEFHRKFLGYMLPHVDACRVKQGVFDRWPGAESSDFSHDEAMGMAYLDAGVADELVEYLTRTDWHYDSAKDRNPNLPPEATVFKPSSYWGRFIFLEPFLRACSTKYSVSLAQQVKWSTHVLVSAFKSVPSKDSSGILKIWLMGAKMQRFFLCKLAYTFWANRLRTKYHASPQRIFSENYLVEVPVLAQIAPETFD